MINKYKITEKDGYVDSYCVSDTDYNFVGQMANYHNVCDGWTKFENGRFVVDEAKREMILAERNKENEIERLKEELASTDYMAIKYSEGWYTEEEYAPIKAQREAIREQIRALED